MSRDVDERLIEAVKAGDLSGVTLALGCGANPNITLDLTRRSVVAEAADLGLLEIVRLLLEAGAEVEPADPYGHSALRAAIRDARADVVQSLIAHGALNRHVANRRGILTEAVSHSVFHPTPAALETLRVLLREQAIPATDEQAPLITAVMGSAPPAVLRILLEHGADPDQRRTDETPAIVLAARLGDHAAVDVLLQAGGDMEARDAQGRTALMHAIERGEKRTVGALLLAGAATDAVSADGMTALKLARGWQRQNLEFMLGQNRAGRDNVPINRTAVRLTSTAVRITGDPQMLRLMASVINIAIDDLGRNEWSTRTGTDAEAALAFAERLREDAQSATSASWYQLDATADELHTARAALGELAYGTTRSTPDGVSRLQIIDLLEELNRQTMR